MTEKQKDPIVKPTDTHATSEPEVKPLSDTHATTEPATQDAHAVAEPA
ncbi:hypothetical protein [Streptomyces sp. NPDC088725]